MRPLFPESWRNETQINAMVLSADSDNDPDVIAVTGAAAAAYCSDLPFPTPIAAVRVGLVKGQLVANPTVAEQKTSLINIVIAGSDEAIMMVESGALEVSEKRLWKRWNSARPSEEDCCGNPGIARAAEAEQGGSVAVAVRPEDL